MIATNLKITSSELLPEGTLKPLIDLIGTNKTAEITLRVKPILTNFNRNVNNGGGEAEIKLIGKMIKIKT